MAKVRWFVVKPLVSGPQSLYPWTDLALARSLFPMLCVRIFILPAGSYLGVEGSLLFLHKQRLWDETVGASRPNPWAWLPATAACQIHLRHLVDTTLVLVIKQHSTDRHHDSAK